MAVTANVVMRMIFKELKSVHPKLWISTVSCMYILFPMFSYTFYVSSLIPGLKFQADYSSIAKSVKLFIEFLEKFDN